MANKDYKAFIVEGEAREPLIIDNISKVFFKHANFKIVTLPAGQNIYMLWKKLKEDDFDTEVLREESEDVAEQLDGLNRDDFSEVFLFFDYDGHQNNIDKNNTEDIIKQMLASFDNETENGKLYISYPMVEALRDFAPGICGKVFILSAFPEFLLDYFKISFWKTCVKHSKNNIGEGGCIKI